MRAARPASAVAGVVIALGLSVLLGGVIPSTSVLGRLPPVSDVQYSPSPGRIAPLREALVSEFLNRVGGDRVAAILAQPTPPPAAAPRPGASSAPRPSPTSTPSTPPGIFGQQRGNPEDLRVFLSAPAQVAPGVEMTYVVTILNVGTQDFARQFTIQAHIPITTTLAEPRQCDIPGLLGPNPICQALIFPIPGTYSEETGEGLPTHPVTYGTTGASVLIRPGQTFVYRFKVNVNPGTPDGQRLSNHAHFSTGGMAPRNSHEVATVVKR